MKALFVLVRLWAVRVGFLVGRTRPVGRDVVLATSHAPALAGNLAEIARALGAHPDVRVRTVAYVPSRTVRGRVRALLASVLAGYRLARARLFVVDDYFFPLYAVRPRRRTTVVQVWHACGALKKFGYSVADKTFGAEEAITSRVRIHSHYDVCLVSSGAAVPAYAEAFGQPPERFVSSLGIPRTDLLVHPEAAAAARDAVRRRYGIADGRRVILWTPTFRGDRITEARADESLDLGTLRAALGEDHVLLVRLHPFVRASFSVPPGCEDFAIDVSDHPSINELMLASDVLVTDYSSTVFEFALLERPIALFAPDLEAYERERGFYVDYRTAMPGPVFETTEPLAAWLRSGAFDLERVRAFAREWFDVADGHATERFIERVVLPSVAGTRVTAESLRT
ncbi:MAG TPA: CDP-glycerol glycerophosphotransferase family protein [Candidatus Limnocylindrales bacterium]|nr:CDP-glycerol glycerophosphotransferase family protein [Candidatus Limnocylindrales bacterium]